jgi:hypothetical protein
VLREHQVDVELTLRIRLVSMLWPHLKVAPRPPCLTLRSGRTGSGHVTAPT